MCLFSLLYLTCFLRKLLRDHPTYSCSKLRMVNFGVVIIEQPKKMTHLVSIRSSHQFFQAFLNHVAFVTLESISIIVTYVPLLNSDVTCVSILEGIATQPIFFLKIKLRFKSPYPTSCTFLF